MTAKCTTSQSLRSALANTWIFYQCSEKTVDQSRVSFSFPKLNKDKIIDLELSFIIIKKTQNKNSLLFTFNAGMQHAFSDCFVFKHLI